MNSIRQGASASFIDMRRLMLVGTASVAALTIAGTAFAQANSPQTGNAGTAEVAAGQEPVVGAGASSDTANSGVQPSGQEIVVTGSRISRRDYQANSPIVTVDNSLLEQSSTSSIAANLNQLPQFTPANGKTPTTSGGDIQPTARNTPGSSSISLRGIGSNRTLVLINGRRATPADATGTVDINTIPSAAVERVEIISGGASSTYGADAVAGVTNFILRSHFQGFELDAQEGITQRGDNNEFRVSGILGTNFPDNRGNISLSFEYNKRDAAYQRDRSYYRDNWANPNITGSGFFPSGVAGIAEGYTNPVNPAAIASIFGATAAASIPSVGGYFFVNPDGTIYNGFSSLDSVTGSGGASRAENVDGYRVKRLANGQISPNFTDALLVSPLSRYTMFAQGNYEINDWVSVFGQGQFSNTHTRGVQEPSPVVNGWSATVNYDPANPQANIPQQLRTILNARANPNAPFTIFQMLPFDRESAANVYSYNMTAGLDFKLPGTDWTAELYGQQGKTQSTVTQRGFGSLQRYRTIINSPNFGQGFKATGNAEQGGFGASTATCTSGLNPFGGAISADCLEAIKADIKTRSEMHQSIAEFDAQGTIFKLPAGDLKAAIGASYRKNDYVFENDTLTTQGRSFLEQSIGLYPAGNSSGTLKAKEVYGELLVPVLHDIPAIKEFDLELGGRISDYNTTGTSYTYKILGDWQVTNWLRFRGGFNRAERTPNVAELYLAPEQSFAFAAGGDVCSRLNGQAWSANPAANPTHAAGVEALCRTLMARSGNPNAATQYYNNVQGVGGSFVFPTLTGNPNLHPEKADTYTAGVVISSPFESALLRRLRLTVDYYNIKVSDAIGAQSVDIAQRQCFDTQFNPTLSATSPYCAGVNRNQDGGLGNVITTFQNNGRFRTSGVDAQVDWVVPAGPGQLNVNVQGNYLISIKSAELSVLPLVEYRGTLGPTQNGLNGGSYKWKLFTTVGYNIGGYGLALQWRHLPGVKQETAAIVPTTTIGGYPSYDIFNLSGTAAVTRDITLRFGIDNLFDKNPPLGGVDSAPVAGALSGGSFNATYYDTIGRRFYIGAKAKF